MYKNRLSSVAGKTYDEIRNMLFPSAYMIGRSWGNSHLKGLSKFAADSITNIDYDIERTLRALDFDPNRKIIKEKLKDLEPEEYHSHVKTQNMNSRDFKLTTAMNNIYTLGALRIWENKGIKLARRIEIQDDKICPLCVAKNGELYEIESLVTNDLPLIFDTHPHCRGSFIPIIGHITKRPDHAAERHVTSFVGYGNSVEDLPIEYKPFLVPFLKRMGKLPFKIKFDEKLDCDYQLKKERLIINPRSSDCEDPREVIARMAARAKWPTIEDKFKREYGTLLKMGLVHPNRSSKSWPELFENTFKEFKLNQLDEPYEVLWCRTNLAA